MLWHYLTGYARVVEYEQNFSGNKTKGTTMCMTCTLGDDEVLENMLNCNSRYLRNSMLISEGDFVDFFAGLQQEIGLILPKPLELKCTTLKAGCLKCNVIDYCET